MVKRTPSRKYPNVYSYPTQKGVRWGAVADHGMVNGVRVRPRKDGFEKEKEARAWQVETLAAGPVDRPTGMTLGQWMDRWLQLREHEIEYGTRTSYRYALALFDGLRGIPLAELRPAEIAVALSDLGRSHHAGTVRQARRVLSACCNAAVAMEAIPRNPVTRTTAPREGRERERVLTAGEVRALLSALQDNEQWYLPIRVLAECWLRIGELQGLQWGDVGADHIRVSRTARESMGGFVVGSTAKTKGSVREIPVSADLLSLFPARQHPNALVFTDPIGGMLNRGRLRRALAAACVAAGLPVITPHGLRHAGASMAIAAGMDPKIASERLGHASVKFTYDRYVTTNATTHREAAELVGSLLKGVM